jgi:hypothetical protein
MARDPEESEFGVSGFLEARNSCMLESRSTISRRALNHPSAEDAWQEILKSRSLGHRSF